MRNINIVKRVVYFVADRELLHFSRSFSVGGEWYTGVLL